MLSPIGGVALPTTHRKLLCQQMFAFGPKLDCQDKLSEFLRLSGATTIQSLYATLLPLDLCQSLGGIADQCVHVILDLSLCARVLLFAVSPGVATLGDSCFDMCSHEALRVLLCLSLFSG